MFHGVSPSAGSGGLGDEVDAALRRAMTTLRAEAPVYFSGLRLVAPRGAAQRAIHLSKSRQCRLP